MTIACPNCGTTMEEEGRCSECSHLDDSVYDCECDWCNGERERWDLTYANERMNDDSSE